MTALVAMSAETFSEQFDNRRLQRLRSLIPTTTPLRVDDLDQLPAGLLPTVEVLMTGWGAPTLDAARLDLLPSLEAVIHCAGSVKSMVTPALWRRGIKVSSAAEVNAIPVAEFTFAAIVMAGKKAPFLAADARVHRDDLGYRTGRGRLSNHGLRVGIIGFSRIGRRVVAKLQQLDEVTCLVADPFADPLEVAAAGGTLVNLDSLLQNVDIVSIHAPDLPSTHQMISRYELGQMTDHATLINTARGALVDTAA
ncbi:MAG TPA: hydroxyacid dehydrogenase, partial [Microlunatus sp.]|nr:hydroxyacid dehydrogenase [Microlunatus sp.]